MNARPALIFAGGYTAGHITPGLAVIEHLRDTGAECDFLFMGAADSWERELVTKAGVPFVGVPAMPWAAQRIGTRCAALVRLVPAVFAARRSLRSARATGLFGLGSFASVAPALAARSLGLPVTLYEPNATLGLANRLLRRSTRALLVSRLFSAETARRRDKIVEVGVPLRVAVLALANELPPPPQQRLQLLVLGGSRGNPFLNDRMPEVAARLHAIVPELSVTHQCGHDVASASLTAHYTAAGVAAQVTPYLDPIAAHFRAAHFVVSAAGAISLHELAAAGVPSLIVPLDRGGGAHQRHNATAFARLTGCPLAARQGWSAERVADEIIRTVRDAEKWRARQTALRALAASGRPDAFSREVVAIALAASRDVFARNA